MTKKIITVILFGCLFGLVTGKCFADVSAQLDQALAYKKAANFSQAESIYQNIIATQAGTEDAVKAKINLARMYKKTSRYSEAETLYQDVLAGNPGLVNGFEARKHLAILYIAAGRDRDAQIAIDGLRANFSDYLDLPNGLNAVARAYQRYGKNELAKNVYRAIRSLQNLGFTSAEAKALAFGKPVLTSIPNSGGEDTIVISQFINGRLRVGILSIEDTSGTGANAFGAFRTFAYNTARALGVDKVDMFGATVINSEVEAMLIRQGFQSQTWIFNISELEGLQEYSVYSKTIKVP